MNNLKYLILLISLEACNFIQSPTLKIIQFRSSDKFITGKKVESFDSKINIAYYGDLTAYEVPIINFKTFESKYHNDTLTNHLSVSDTSYIYFLIKKGKRFGLQYNSIKSFEYKSFALDSLLRLLSLHETMMGIYNVDLKQPLEIKKNPKSGKIEYEKYASKFLETDADTIYRYYDDQLSNVNFSFSKRLDEEKKSKLYKTVFLYLGNEKNLSRKELKPKIIGMTEIKEVNLSYSKELIALLKRFERDDGNSIR